MTHVFRRVTNVFFALLLAVFSINLSGVMSLHTTYADPSGNNGTIKIAESDADDNDNSNANDPHITGCNLNVKFFGYDTGARTATVTFEAQPPTAGQLVSPLGAQNVNFTGLGGDGNTLDHTQPYTLAFSGVPQPNQGYHVKVTVHADGSQGNDTKHKTIWVEGCEPALTPVTPVAPTSLNPCGVASDTYTVPSTTGVIYKVNGVITPAGTYHATGSVTITVVADTGYVLQGTTTSWTFTFTNAACPVTATPPTKVDVCGTTNDTYTIPSTTGVFYKVNGVTKSAGTYSVTPLQYIFGVTITAHATSGYALQDTTSWTFTFSAQPCAVTPANPTKVDVCGTTNDTYTIPSTAHVKYYVNGVYKPAGTYAASPITLIVAIADAGYYIPLNEQSVWPFVFTNKACPQPCVPNFAPLAFTILHHHDDDDVDCIPVPATPGNPSKVDACGTTHDTYTIPSTTGVIYKVNGVITPAGTYPATGTVTITAVAATGYVLSGTAEWTFTFTDEACEPEPCTPTMVSAITLSTLVNDDNCAPGMGGGGTPTIVKTSTTFSTPTELPQTGPEASSTFTKLFMVITAGLVTYSVMFFLVNRRDLVRK